MTPEVAGTGHRLDNLRHNETIKRESNRALNPVNNELLRISQDSDADYAGLVLFIPESEYLLPVVSLDGSAEVSRVNDFRNENIDGRRVLTQTAIGRYLKSSSDQPEYVHSLMNPAEHMTLVYPYKIESFIAGAIQVAMNTRRTNVIPDMNRLVSVLDVDSSVIRNVIHSFKNLPDETETLSDRLEFEDAVAPTAYVVRWDIENSTPLALGPDSVPFKKNLVKLMSHINNLELKQADLVSGLGDGQNLVVYIPSSINPSDTASVSGFGKNTIQPLIDKINRYNTELSYDYPEFDLKLKFAVDLYYVDKTISKLDQNSTAFWRTAKLLDEKGPEQVSYTDEAFQTLKMDGADRAKLKQAH